MKTNRDRTISPIRYRNKDSTLTQGKYRNITTLTPIEQLVAYKSIVEAKCAAQQKKLYEDVEYIQNNASSLIFSGLVSLLFSSGQTKKKPETQSVMLINDSQSTRNNNLLSSSTIFFVAKKMIPVVWEIVQPLLINWGIKKAKSLLVGLFTKKKSVPVKNRCKNGQDK